MAGNHNYQSRYEQWTESKTAKSLNMRARAPGNNIPDPFPKSTERTTRGWIGVDLDGTLAKSVKAKTREEIGSPIHPMVQLVKIWLAHGEDVRIFTARVNPNRGQASAMRARRAIEGWCKHHLGRILPITYEKDWDMTLLFDDRARQVERDTGRVFCHHSRENRIAQESRTARSGNRSQETKINK